MYVLILDVYIRMRRSFILIEICFNRYIRVLANSEELFSLTNTRMNRCSKGHHLWRPGKPSNRSNWSKRTLQKESI